MSGVGVPVTAGSLTSATSPTAVDLPTAAASPTTATSPTPPPPLIPAIATLLRRDFTLAHRRRGRLLLPPLFFVIIATLFAFALSPEPRLLAAAGAVVVWVAALLAVLLAQDSLFRADFADGSLEQLLISPHPPTLLVLTKTAAHWLLTGVPLALVSPLPAALLNLPPQAWPALALSLLLGSAVLCLIGGIGAALTLAARGGAALPALVILPLNLPPLLFGVGIVRAAALGGGAAAEWLLLGALLALALALAPAAMVAGLRVSLD